VPDSVDDSSDIILEVTAGVGGQEAMLFTKEILSMYLGYAQFRGWAANFISHQEDLDLGSFPSFIFTTTSSVLLSINHFIFLSILNLI